jgi:pyridoxamine 5'-phosphate oxidase family protein
VRGLVVLAEVVVVLMAAYLAYSAIRARRRGRPRELETGEWQLLHYAQNGHTVVAVARETAEGHVIEKHVVTSIADTDQNWSRKFVEAKLDAEERAFHLNADRSTRDM